MAEATENIAILLQLKTEEMQRAARNAENTIARLERKFSPLQAAETRLEKQQKKLNAALEAGTLDVKRHAQGMDLLQREHEQTVARINGTTAAMGRMAAASGSNVSFMDRNRNAFQQAGYQIGDFAVQVQGGTSAITAFTQQGSQMLGVFGAYGAIAGAVLAVGAPIIATFLNSGAGATTYKEALKDLNKALEAYQEVARETLLTNEELSVSYGDQAEMIRGSITLLRELALAEALTAAKEAAAALSHEFRNVFSALSDQNAGYFDTFVIADMEMARDEATRLRDALAAIGDAEGPQEISDRVREMNSLLLEAYGSVENIPEEFQVIAKRAAEVDVITTQLNKTLDDTRVSVWEIVDAAYSAAQGFAAAGGPVDALYSKVTRLASAAWEYAGAMGQAGLAYERQVGRGRGGDPRQFGGAARDIQQNDPAAQLAYQPGGTAGVPLPKRKGGGGRKRSGGGSKGKRQESIFAATERDLQNLERQIEYIGKSKSEIAGLTTKYKLLDEAKKRGLDLDTKQAETGKTLSETIDAQAASMERLTEEYERGQRTQQQFEQGVDSIAEAMAGVIVDGEDWRESMANIFRGLARDILTSGIKQSILSVFQKPKTGGGGFLGNLFGRGLFAGFFDKGGNIPRGQFGIAGENGPEIIRGPAAVTSTKATAAMMGGGDSVVRIELGDGLIGGILQQAGNQTVQIVSAATRGQQQALPASMQRVSARGTT